MVQRSRGGHLPAVAAPHILLEPQHGGASGGADGGANGTGGAGAFPGGHGGGVDGGSEGGASGGADGVDASASARYDRGRNFRI